MIPTPAKAALAVVALIGLCACEARHAPLVITAKIVDAIKTDEVHWNADYRSGDPAKVASHYARDAVVMLPGEAPLIGAAAVKAALDQAYQDPHFGVTFSSDKVDVARSGDLAATRGSWRQTTTDPASKKIVVASGTYVTVYRPQPNGKWLAVWDILTPGPATVAAKAPG